MHHYAFHHNRDLRWRSELGLLWGIPLLAAAAALLPSLRNRKLILIAGGTLLCAGIAAGVGNPTLSLFVTHAVPLAGLLALLYTEYAPPVSQSLPGPASKSASRST